MIYRRCPKKINQVQKRKRNYARENQKRTFSLTMKGIFWNCNGLGDPKKT